MENQEIQEIKKEIWEVEANGDVFQAGFEDLSAWIADGSLLRMDRIRKGNLRWIEAGKVPALLEFFNAKDAAEPAKPIITTATYGEPAAAAISPSAGTASGDFCAVHTDAPAKYSCETCGSLFCKACPTGYGANVKICPFCGAMCAPVDAPISTAEPNHGATRVVSDGSSFGISDIGRALALPFRYPVSFIIGALMFAFFTIGQSGAGFGGGSIFMLGAVIICFMMANMLTFGVLANTVENFAQGKLDEGFMPSFDDFNIWDDVVHPFFLSIGAYVSSFVPLFVVVMIGMFAMAGGAVQDKMNEPLREQAKDQLTQPQFKYVERSVEQSKEVRELLKQSSNVRQQRVQDIERQMEQGITPTDPAYTQAANAQEQRVRQVEQGITPATAPGFESVETEEEAMQKIVEMTQQARRQQLESTIGKAPETVEKENEALAQSILNKGGVFLFFVGTAFLFGLCYFPAACMVAGYTRSLGATLNPSVVLDTIKHLGASYFGILLVSVVLLIASVAVGFVFGLIFGAFNLPGLGNIPAKGVSAFITFYFWIVWSAVLGYALYRKADRFQLLR